MKWIRFAMVIVAGGTVGFVFARVGGWATLPGAFCLGYIIGAVAQPWLRGEDA